MIGITSNSNVRKSLASKYRIFKKKVNTLASVSSEHFCPEEYKHVKLPNNSILYMKDNLVNVRFGNGKLIRKSYTNIAFSCVSDNNLIIYHGELVDTVDTIDYYDVIEKTLTSVKLSTVTEIPSEIKVTTYLSQSSHSNDLTGKKYSDRFYAMSDTAIYEGYTLGEKNDSLVLVLKEILTDDFSTSMMYLTKNDAVCVINRESNSDTKSNVRVITPSYMYGSSEIKEYLIHSITNRKNSIIVLGDMYEFVAGKDAMRYVMMMGGNGSIIPFENGDFTKEIDNSVDVPISSTAITNSRISNTSNDKYILQFDPRKNISEFTNRYIGVSKEGKTYDTCSETGLSAYELSNMRVISLMRVPNRKSVPDATIYADLDYIFKTKKRNIVAEIKAVTRLNTSLFTKRYETTAAESCGDVYAFTDKVQYNKLVRNDISFYDDTCIVSISNSSVVRIKVDGKWHTYSIGDEEFPFAADSKALPVVLTYGTREDGTPRYYIFVDSVGRASTYDTENTSFINANGDISVDFPYFSSELEVIPTDVTKLGSLGARVWAHSEKNPYIDEINHINHCCVIDQHLVGDEPMMVFPGETDWDYYDPIWENRYTLEYIDLDKIGKHNTYEEYKKAIEDYFGDPNRNDNPHTAAINQVERDCGDIRKLIILRLDTPQAWPSRANCRSFTTISTFFYTWTGDCTQYASFATNYYGYVIKFRCDNHTSSYPPFDTANHWGFEFYGHGHATYGWGIPGAGAGWRGFGWNVYWDGTYDRGGYNPWSLPSSNWPANPNPTGRGRDYGGANPFADQSIVKWNDPNHLGSRDGVAIPDFGHEVGNSLFFFQPNGGTPYVRVKDSGAIKLWRDVFFYRSLAYASAQDANRYRAATRIRDYVLAEESKANDDEQNLWLKELDHVWMKLPIEEDD